jgi:hypothetical protein
MCENTRKMWGVTSDIPIAGGREREREIEIEKEK